MLEPSNKESPNSTQLLGLTIVRVANRAQGSNWTFRVEKMCSWFSSSKESSKKEPSQKEPSEYATRSFSLGTSTD
jgi:hypothetical protein